GVSPAQGNNGNIESFAPSSLGGSYRVVAGLGQPLPFGPGSQINIAAELYHQNGPSFVCGPQTSSNEDGTPYNFGPRTPPGLWGGRIRDQYYTTVPALYTRAQIGDFAIMLRGELYQRATPVHGFSQQNTDFDESRSWERDRWVSADIQYN